MKPASKPVPPDLVAHWVEHLARENALTPEQVTLIRLHADRLVNGSAHERMAAMRFLAPVRGHLGAERAVIALADHLAQAAHLPGSVEPAPLPAIYQYLQEIAPNPRVWWPWPTAWQDLTDWLATHRPGVAPPTRQAAQSALRGWAQMHGVWRRERADRTSKPRGGERPTYGIEPLWRRDLMPLAEYEELLASSCPRLRRPAGPPSG